MAIIELNRTWEDDRSIDELTSEELADYKAEILSRIEALDQKEPRSMNSEAYEAWSEAHEVLEDVLDDILDREEELGL